MTKKTQELTELSNAFGESVKLLQNKIEEANAEIANMEYSKFDPLTNFAINNSIKDSIELGFHVEVFAPDENLKLKKEPEIFSKEAKEYDYQKIKNKNSLKNMEEQYKKNRKELPSNYLPQTGEWKSQVVSSAKKTNPSISSPLIKESEKAKGMINAV